MIDQILSRAVEALSRANLTEKLSESDLKAIYALTQIFRILTVIIWVFSGITSAFIGKLLNPQSSLFDWSSNHKYLVVIACTVFLYTPATLMFFLTSRLLPLATVLYKSQPVQGFSPRIVWILSFFVFAISLPLLALIYNT